MKVSIGISSTCRAINKRYGPIGYTVRFDSIQIRTVAESSLFFKQTIKQTCCILSVAIIHYLSLCIVYMNTWLNVSLNSRLITYTVNPQRLSGTSSFLSLSQTLKKSARWLAICLSFSGIRVDTYSDTVNSYIKKSLVMQLYFQGRVYYKIET